LPAEYASLKAVAVTISYLPTTFSAFRAPFILNYQKETTERID